MKDNKLIAEFMEVDGFLSLSQMNYHTSWDWLMPVVEKIERDERYDVDILQYGTRIRENSKKEIVNNIADISFDKKIEHTYDAIVKFIQYYQKKNVIAGVDFSESINQLNNL